MRRYQYRLNDQNVSLGPWAAVQPLKYIETIPGETYGGTITVKATTGLIDKVVHSRAYYDLYAFYCPIRILWPDFPDHLQSSEDRQTGDRIPPVVRNLWPENFESSWVGQDGTTNQNGEGQNSAFLRRMYNMVGHHFFADEKEPRDLENIKRMIQEGQFDETVEPSLVAASARPSTFETSWKTSPTSDTEIGTDSYGKFKLKDLRQAYALDRFEKMRSYYGGRYVDVLRGYGVKADWGILQEPECIGISNNDFRFVQRNSTGDVNFGQRNGYFEGEYKLKLRKTFCPEHGIIAVYAVARGDVFNTTSGAHILCSRDLKTSQMWYDPITWGPHNEQSFPKALMDKGASRGEMGYSPIGEHLRKGRNEIAVPEGTDITKMPVFGRSMTQYRNSTSKWGYAACNPDETADVRDSGKPVTKVRNGFDLDEEGNIVPRIDIAAAEISHYTEVRLAKRSPLPPAPVTVQR